MKGIKPFLISTALLLLLSSQISYAKAILTITGTNALVSKNGEATTTTFTVTNNSGRTLTLTEVALSSSSELFAKSITTDACSGQTIAAGDDCTVTATLTGKGSTGRGQLELIASLFNSTVRVGMKNPITVTLTQPTLSSSVQALALSVNDADNFAELTGSARKITITNSGSVAATGVQVSSTDFPTDTSITENTCTDTLDVGDTCDITITPGATASSDSDENACTTSPGTVPVPTTVTVSADNASSTDISILVLGYGCIYQGGYLFSVDDETLDTGSIGGKVAALTDEDSPIAWATEEVTTGADSLTDGSANTDALNNPEGQYPAAQACLNKSSSQGFTDWYLPAICELGRGNDPDAPEWCGGTNPNLYTTLHKNSIGGFADDGRYWSSTEGDPPQSFAWFQTFDDDGTQDQNPKGDGDGMRVRCVRAFTP